MTDTAEDTQEQPGPGSVLRGTREALGYTLQEMADALNLTVRVVRDLEDERWEKLPATTFARGYVRAYAKLLGLEGDTLIDSCPALRSPDRLAQPAQNSTVRPPRGLSDWAARQPGVVLSGAVVAAVCVVLVVLYLVWPEGTSAPTGQALPAPEIARAPVRDAPRRAPRPVSAGVERPRIEVRDALRDEPGEGAVREFASDRTTPSDAATADRAEATSMESRPRESEVAPASVAMREGTVSEGAQVSLTESAEEAETGPRSARSLVRRISPDGDDRVDFEFTEDCWVEVADAGGRSYADLSRAGDSLVLVGQAPFRIRLGYGPGASVAFNGEQVALAPHTRRNVTSLVLAPSDPLEP